MAQFEGKNALKLTFNRDILEGIDGDLLFDQDDESTQSTHKRALADFRPLEDAAAAVDADPLAAWEQDINQEAYRVKTTSAPRFKMVLGFISMGASFRSSSRFVNVAQTVCQTSFLGCCSECICVTYARITCACSYQAMLEITSGCWGHLIELDVGHDQSTSYLDLRIWLCGKYIKLVGFQAIAISPLFKITAKTKFSLCSKLLAVIETLWHSKLVSVGTDDYCTMTKRVFDVQTPFKQAAEHPVSRIWCGLRQVDLVSQQAYEALYEDMFVSTSTGLNVYLCCQQNIQVEIKSTCPEFVTTRRLSMMCINEWLKANCVRITEYLNTKTSARTPTTY